MTQTITIEDVHQELKAIEKTMVKREDLGVLIDSIEILNNPETMQAIRKSDIDIKKEDTKKYLQLMNYLTSSEYDPDYQKY